MFSISSLPSQAGKIAIVTGANVGLGFETALGLLSKDFTVIIASRNEGKAEAAKKEMLQKFPAADIDIIVLDLADTVSIENFANDFKNRHQRLDLLINNAGIMIPPYQETAQGFESQYGVNYLGHFYLTSLLMPALEKAPSSRVVTLASLAHFSGKIYFDDINQKDNYKPMEMYRQSKLACLIFAYELQRRLGNKGSSVTSYGAHPGVAKTNLFASMPAWMQVIAPLFTWMLHSVKDGAEPTLMAAMDTELEGGEYLGPTGWRSMKGPAGVTYSNTISKDEAVGKRLWELSEKQLDFKFDIR